MTTEATLPAPTIATALDGGLGYNDLVDRDVFTYVQVGPIPKAKADDTVVVKWDGADVAQYRIKPGDLGTVFSIPVSNGKIADIGDGAWVVTYTVTYNLGGGEDSSKPSEPITVKRTVPGGLDPKPSTPGFNENLAEPSLSPNPVPPDATQVTAVVPLWINPAKGDQMVLSWKGQRFFAPLLPAAPFPSEVSVTLTAQDILDAGVGPAVPVTWGVHDIVANWSGWAKEVEVEVRLEDPGLLLAPRVGDKDEPWTQITPADLAGKPLAVFTPDYEGAAEGDLVTIHAHGTALDGSKVAFDSTPQAMPLPGYGMTFQVPNAIVMALAGSTARIWYTVANRPDSHSVWLPVVGAAQGDFPVPLVAEAVDTDDDGLADWLDPDTAKPAHVTIDYATMARDDLVTLVLEGTAANGTPVKLTYSKQIGTPAPVTFDVPQTDILQFIDGTMDVYYQVSPYSRRRVLNRALGEPESAHLPLRVRRETAEEPLPAPTVRDDKGAVIAQGGYLDPAAAYADALAIYPDMAKDDEITYSWVGTVSTHTETYRVRDPESPPADRTDRNFIVTNSSGKVAISYSVRRAGAGSAIPSITFQLSISQATLVIDQTPLLLSGAIFRTMSVVTNPPAGAFAVRQARGGQPPYTYRAENADIVDVDPASGRVISKRSSSTRVIVTDAANQQVAYPVSVSNVQMLFGLGVRGTFWECKALAQGPGGGYLPTLEQWAALRRSYGNAPFLGDDTIAWAMDVAGIGKRWGIHPDSGGTEELDDMIEPQDTAMGWGLRRS